MDNLNSFYSKIALHHDLELVKKLNQIGVLIGDDLDQCKHLTFYIPTNGWFPLFRKKFRALLSIYKKHTREDLEVDPWEIYENSNILSTCRRFSFVFAGYKTPKQMLKFSKTGNHLYYLYKNKLYNSNKKFQFFIIEDKDVPGYPRFGRGEWDSSMRKSGREEARDFEEWRDIQNSHPRLLKQNFGNVCHSLKGLTRYEELVSVVSLNEHRCGIFAVNHTDIGKFERGEIVREEIVRNECIKEEIVRNEETKELEENTPVTRLDLYSNSVFSRRMSYFVCLELDIEIIEDKPIYNKSLTHSYYFDSFTFCSRTTYKPGRNWYECTIKNRRLKIYRQVQGDNYPRIIYF